MYLYPAGKAKYHQKQRRRRLRKEAAQNYYGHYFATLFKFQALLARPPGTTYSAARHSKFHHRLTYDILF
jgi:hypothetical protein